MPTEFWLLWVSSPKTAEDGLSLLMKSLWCQINSPGEVHLYRWESGLFGIRLIPEFRPRIADDGLHETARCGTLQLRLCVAFPGYGIKNKCYSNPHVTQIQRLYQSKYYTNPNVTQIQILHKSKYYTNTNVTQIQRFYQIKYCTNPKVIPIKYITQIQIITKIQMAFNRWTTLRLLITPLTKTPRGLQELEFKHKKDMFNPKLYTNQNITKTQMIHKSKPPAQTIHNLTMHV